MNLRALICCLKPRLTETLVFSLTESQELNTSLYSTNTTTTNATDAAIDTSHHYRYDFVYPQPRLDFY